MGKPKSFGEKQQKGGVKKWGKKRGFSDSACDEQKGVKKKITLLKGEQSILEGEDRARSFMGEKNRRKNQLSCDADGSFVEEVGMSFQKKGGKKTESVKDQRVTRHTQLIQRKRGGGRQPGKPRKKQKKKGLLKTVPKHLTPRKDVRFHKKGHTVPGGRTKNRMGQNTRRVREPMSGKREEHKGFHSGKKGEGAWGGGGGGWGGLGWGGGGVGGGGWLGGVVCGGLLRGVEKKPEKEPIKEVPLSG